MKQLLYIILVFGFLGNAQEKEVDQKAIKASTNYTWEANEDLVDNNFTNAEANYRKAISKNSENATAPYNLGNAYYNKETYSEAFGRFKQAGEIATNKADKHSAYHNMGNVFMKNKEYQKAVDAYKEALRNNPTDEETRYNLALAKEMLKKEEEEKKNDENKDNQDKEDKEDEEKEENKDKKDKGDNQEEDEGDPKDDEDKDEGEDGDEGDKGEEEPEENKEGDGDEKKEEEKKPNEGEQPQQPKPNQLSPQQVQNLLEAMQNEEKKVQEKMDAQKVKGVQIKNEKDW